jgi:phage FluMu protein gp41
MVKEQLQDGIVLAARILTAIDIVAKAVRDFGAAQGPEAARQVLEPAQPQFAVIQQSLAALAGCCGSTLDRDAGRLRVETTVERASAAFLELKAAVQSPNPGG